MLDINLGLLIFTAIVFFALIYLLNSILYQPLLGFMQKREDLIKDDLNNISENSGDVESALEKASTLILDAKSEAAKIRENATNEAKEAASKELATAQEAIEAKYEAFVQELGIQREGLKQELVGNLSTYQNALQSKLKNI